MKGIRKLFFGLILMTLIGVGFKVDAKADITLGFKEPDWSINDGDSGSGLKAKIFATDPTDFPIPSPSATDNTYSVSVISSDDASGQFSISHGVNSIKKWNGKIYLITRKSTDNSYYIAIGDSTPVSYTPTTTNPQDVLISDLIATRSDVKTEIENEAETTSGSGVKTGEFKVNGKAPIIITNYDDLPIAIQNLINGPTNFDTTATSSAATPSTGTSYSIYRVKLESSGNGSANISFRNADGNTISEVWLLPGESSGAITAVKSETSPTHIFTSFTGNGGIDSSSLTTDYSGPKATFNIKTGIDAATGTLTANYSEISNTTISVSEGKSVYLSSFLNISSDVLATTTSSNISVFPNTKTSASFVIITGTSVGTATINVNGNSYSVKVYPKPTISGPGASSGGSSAIILDDDSKSGSSKAMSFTVPKIVRYDTPSGSVADSDISFARIYFEGNKKRGYVDRSVSGSADSISGSLTIKQITQVLSEVCDDSCDVKITVYPEEYDVPSKTITIEVHKIKLNRDEGATYTVRQGNSEIISSSDSTETFYAIDGLKYNIKSSAKSGSSGMKFERWDNSNNKNWDTADGGDFDADESKTFKAIYKSNASNSSSQPTPTPSNSNRSSEGGGMDDYDDVPKTGESKADIWILWSVLFVSILGAGFMIWKRFGLVRAIAEADEEVAVAEHKEEVKAKKKEKEDKIKMLKDLRNL